MDWRLVPATACRGDQGTRTAPAETAKKEAESLAPIDELLAKPGEHPDADAALAVVYDVDNETALAAA